MRPSQYAFSGWISSVRQNIICNVFLSLRVRVCACVDTYTHVRHLAYCRFHSHRRPSAIMSFPRWSARSKLMDNARRMRLGIPDIHICTFQAYLVAKLELLPRPRHSRRRAAPCRAALSKIRTRGDRDITGAQCGMFGGYCGCAIPWFSGLRARPNTLNI